jgi:hypothetical protein
MARIDRPPDPKLPKLDLKARCPDHPKYEAEVGFGLAGGGYGTYTCCTICCRILTKTQED